MKTIIKNALLVNEGKISSRDVLINDGRIQKIDNHIQVAENCTEINAEGLYLLPGIIDDQVHFREPGLTHKGEIFTESRAAVAGGVTSFMDMPNVNPPSLTQELLEQRYLLAAKRSIANYSFYMGVSNDNVEEVLKTDPKTICGIKIFMGSSTGNMLVDDKNTLENLFRNAPTLIATHCEDEATILHNLELAEEKFGDDIPIHYHPIIRNEEACFRSSSFAAELAKKWNTRLHILHISTGEEVILFDNKIALKDKRLTAEVCVHHLFFNADNYFELGNRIKWNPAIKDKKHQPLLFEALLNDHFDVIATDHAPHTWEEKSKSYRKCPGGGPLVQHSLLMMLDFYFKGNISLQKIVEKMSHNVATCFDIVDRGFIREGYFADLILVDLSTDQRVTKENLLYKCGWSPLEGRTFKGQIKTTFVNGNIVYDHGKIIESASGSRLLFNS